MTEKQKTKFKDKIKNTGQEVYDTVDLVRCQGKIQGAEWALRNYDRYKKLAHIFLWAVLLYFILISSWQMAFIAYGILHLHSMINQNIWGVRNLEYYIEKCSKK